MGYGTGGAGDHKKSILTACGWEDHDEKKTCRRHIRKTHMSPIALQSIHIERGQDIACRQATTMTKTTCLFAEACTIYVCKPTGNQQIFILVCPCMAHGDPLSQPRCQRISTHTSYIYKINVQSLSVPACLLLFTSLLTWSSTFLLAKKSSLDRSGTFSGSLLSNLRETSFMCTPKSRSWTRRVVAQVPDVLSIMNGLKLVHDHGEDGRDEDKDVEVVACVK